MRALRRRYGRARAYVAPPGPYETRAVLAGAYRENPTPKSLLTHTVIAATDEPLCKRVRADSIVDTYGSDDVNAPSTCPVCLSRDPRFRQA